ncbi:MAG: SRPBCC family protein [Planctomycetota bacterium]|nr:SRPBCC family protein [Planctomycetota bacterium]
MKLETTHHLPVPLDRAFAYATDFEHIAERVTAITACEVLTPGPVGTGTRFRETRIVFGKKTATETMEIAAFDPPNSYAVDCDSHGCRYRTDFTFTAEGDGTRVDLVFVAEPYTTGAKILGFLFKGMLKKCLIAITQDLDELAAAIRQEEGASTAS